MGLHLEGSPRVNCQKACVSPVHHQTPAVGLRQTGPVTRGLRMRLMSNASVIAEEAVCRIAALYAIEKEIPRPSSPTPSAGSPTTRSPGSTTFSPEG